MKHLFFSLLAALSFSASSLGEIREIHTLREALPAIEPGTLLVFDLDNTLIEPVGNLGSDQWYYYLIRKYRQVDGMGKIAAQRAATSLWNGVQPMVPLRTVEPGTARFVRQQQARGIRTLGLTAREPALAEMTLAQLRKLELKLEQRTVFPRAFSWWAAEPVRFEAGVLFIGESNDKGTLLIDLLRGLRNRPKRLVFIDDKAKNVASVERAARKAGFLCIAFRYGATDAKVEQFNTDTRDLRLFLGIH